MREMQLKNSDAANQGARVRSKALWSAGIVALMSGLQPIAAPAAAQEVDAPRSADAFPADDIVVTATRTETLRSQTGSAITVLSDTELQQQQATRVFDVLGQVPGVSIAGSESVAPRVNIRGAPFQHTLVLIDGVRMTMPSFRRSEIINTITPDNIERVEVLRGPQSTLYGGDAAAGVVNIITKRGRGPLSGSLSAQYGSWDTVNVRGNARGSNGPVDYSVEGGLFRSDWFSVGARGGERDARRHKTASARLGYEPTENLRVEAILRWVDLYREDDNFGIDVEDRYVEETDYVGRFQVIHDPESGLRSIIGASKSGNTNRFFDNGVADNPKLRQHIVQIDYQGGLDLWQNHALTFGGEYNIQRVDGGVFHSVSPDDITNKAGYLQAHGSFGSLYYTVGGRHDDNSDFGGFSTYKASLSYALDSTTYLKGNVGSGFTTPSVSQLRGSSSCPFGNAALQPEETEAAEIGFEKQFRNTAFGSVRFEVNAFTSKIKNVIVGTSCTGGPPLENRDQRDSKGIEIALQLAATDSLSFNTGFSYIKAEDTARGETLRATGIPSTMTHFGVRYDVTPSFQLNTNVTYNSNRWDPPEVLAGFILVNVAAEYKVADNFAIFGRVDNLTDEYYQTVRRSQTPGRNIHIGIRRDF